MVVVIKVSGPAFLSAIGRLGRAWSPQALRGSPPLHASAFPSQGQGKEGTPTGRAGLQKTFLTPGLPSGAFQKYPVNHVCQNPVRTVKDEAALANWLRGGLGGGGWRKRNMTPTTSNIEKQKNKDGCPAEGSAGNLQPSITWAGPMCPRVLRSVLRPFRHK